MKDFNSIKVIISENDHVIITADQSVYNFIKSGIHNSFDEYIHVDYRQIYIDNLSLCDGSWFPARILSDDGSNLFFIRAIRFEGTESNTIQLSLVSFDALLESHNYMSEVVTTYEAQLGLYDDVFFDYDSEAQTFMIANTQLADFDSGKYSPEEIENLLCQKVDLDKLNAIKSFFGQVKSGAGRFSTRIEGNLLNDDSNISATKMEASYVFLPNGKEHVVGHIQLESQKGIVLDSGLKRDSLTGLLEKSDMAKLAKERIDDRQLDGTALAIVDIDFFKKVNDTFGHQYGDTVIKRIADILSSEVGNNGIAGRFGGDEFLLLFYNIHKEEDLRTHFRSIKKKIIKAFEDKDINDKTTLSVSIGSACYPMDADNYDDLFMLADHCLYIAKEKGRNRYIIYTEEKHGSLASIRKQEMNKKIIDSRGDVSYGDMIITMYNTALHGIGTSIEKLMDEFAMRFNLQKVNLLVGSPFTTRYSTGTQNIEKKEAPNVLLGLLNSDVKDKYLAGRDFIVVNKVDALPPQAAAAKELLKKKGVLSYILIKFNDKNDNECFLIISSLGKYVQWNELHFKYYRAFVDLLSFFSLRPQALK